MECNPDLFINELIDYNSFNPLIMRRGSWKIRNNLSAWPLWPLAFIQRCNKQEEKPLIQAGSNS